MSGKAVDQRVVEMSFDNSKFEANAQTSVKTLDALKKALNLEDAAKGLTGLTVAGRTFSLTSIADGVQALSDRFSTMGIVGMTVIQNITNAAMTAGKQIFDSLVIDPAKMGFQEYETQIGAIQTILANTSKEGTTLTQVNSALDELNAYSDRTIYNFTEMTKNIGTFTAAGVKLDTSVQAIKGIANLAAISGSNSQQASTAMYQLSQALAAGKVSLMDWNSVVNAGMGGQIFQDALKETARIKGIQVDAMIAEAGSFRESLTKNGWVTSEVLTDTLAKFTGDLNEEQLRTMGYTKQQIAEITKLGQMANDAATKVKTFSQLKSTVEEAIQSGWGQTWRILIGDFEEAKTLFTSISDQLGVFIGASSDARNSVLQSWKDLGGRTAILDGIKNIFGAIVKVIGAVSKAFEIIFPPITGKQLYDLSVGFRNLTEKLKMGGTAVAKFKKILLGIASIFKLAFDGIGLLVQGFFSLIRSIPISGSVILDFLSGIADFISGIKDTFSSVDNLKKALSTVGLYLYTFGQNAKKAFDAFLLALSSPEKLQLLVSNIKTMFQNLWTNVWPIISNIGTRLGPVGEMFKQVFQNIGSYVLPIARTVLGFLGLIIQGFVELVNKISGGKINFGFMGDLIENFKPLERLSEVLPGIVEGIKQKLSSLKPIFSAVWNAAKQGFGILGEAITEALKKVNFNDVVQAITAGGIVAIFLEIRKAFKKGAGIIDSITGAFDGIAGALGGIQESLKVWQQSIKADMITKIAIAIGVLALSLFALSMVDSAKLVVALATVVALFAELMATMKTFDKISSSANFAATGKIVIVLLGMSAAILILSYALSQLSTLDSKAIIKGVGAIAALSAVLTKSSKELSSLGGMSFVKTAAGLIIFGLGLLIVAEAVKKISEINVQGMVLGLAGISVALLAISDFMNNTKLDNSSVSKSMGIVVLAGALWAMSFALDKMGQLDPAKLLQSLGVMGAVLAELGIFMRISGDPAHMISMAVGVAILSGALLLLTFPLQAMAAIPQDVIASGLIRMALALGILAAAMQALPKDTLAKSVAVTILSGALYIMAGALSAIGSLPLEVIAKGLLGVFGMLAMMAISLNYMQSALPGAAALLIAAAGLMVFAGVLKIIGSMPIQAIGIALGAVAVFLVMLGVAAWALAPAVPVLLGLSGAILMIGVASAAVGAGVFFFALGLSSLIATLYALGPMLPTLSENFAKAMVAVADAIVVSAPKLQTAFVTMLLGMIDSVRIITPALISAAVELIVNFFETIAKFTPRFVQAGYDILLGMLNGIRNNIGQVVTVCIDIGNEIINAFAAKQAEMIATGWKFVISLIDGWTASVDANMPTLMVSIAKLAGAIIAGLVEGIIGGIVAFGDAFKDLIDGGIRVFKELLGIHSPSTVFNGFGVNIVQGLIDGIKSLLESLKTTIGSMTSAMILKFNEKMSEFFTAGSTLVQNIMAGITALYGSITSQMWYLARDVVGKVTEFATNAYWAGRGLVQNIMDGMASIALNALQAAQNLAQSIMDVLRSIFGVGSNRGWGGEASSVISDSLNNAVPRAINAADNMGNEVVGALTSAISKIGDYLLNDLDTTPVISPVLDLSDVIAKTDQMNSLFGERSLSLATSSSKQMAQNMEATPTTLATPIDPTQTGSITFNQYNNSPKALSTIEIYRQTRNQLNMLKGLVRNPS